jgi:uncharacterized repeat protein (TIGR01451 family)
MSNLAFRISFAIVKHLKKGLIVFFTIMTYMAIAQTTVMKMSNVNNIMSGECVMYTMTFECSKLVESCSNVLITDVIPPGFKFQECFLNLVSIFGIEIRIPNYSKNNDSHR